MKKLLAQKKALLEINWLLSIMLVRENWVVAPHLRDAVGVQKGEARVEEQQEPVGAFGAFSLEKRSPRGSRKLFSVLWGRINKTDFEFPTDRTETKG